MKITAFIAGSLFVLAGLLAGLVALANSTEWQEEKQMRESAGGWSAFKSLADQDKQKPLIDLPALFQNKAKENYETLKNERMAVFVLSLVGAGIFFLGGIVLIAVGFVSKRRSVAIPPLPAS